MSVSVKVESAQFSFGYPFHKWETKMFWLCTCWSCVDHSGLFHAAVECKCLSLGILRVRVLV